jgi:hypothetical protein
LVKNQGAVARTYGRCPGLGAEIAGLPDGGKIYGRDERCNGQKDGWTMGLPIKRHRSIEKGKL